MKKLFSLLLFIAFASPVLAADESDVYVEVEVEFHSMSAGYLQIKDNICKIPRSIDCEKARIKMNSDECNRGNPPEKCKEAKELLESSFCLPGLVFEGVVPRGETIRVRVCKSFSGYGNLSVRDLNNTSIWTVYSLLNDGDNVKYQ
jgi:hypothetical protein